VSPIIAIFHCYRIEGYEHVLVSFLSFILLLIVQSCIGPVPTTFFFEGNGRGQAPTENALKSKSYRVQSKRLKENKREIERRKTSRKRL
jgi:hypothetical protein